MDEIFIEKLTFNIHIGCLPWEAAVRQRVVIDISLFCDCTKAYESDNINNTISYAQVAAHIETLVQQRHFQLIETLAQVISESLLATFAISKVRLRVTKPHCLPQSAATGIVIERQRGQVHLL